MTASRLSLVGAIAATLLLAACSTPAPAPTDALPTEPPAPAVATLSDLEFPFDSPETIASLADARTGLETWYADYTSTCTAEDAGSADSPECSEGILTTLQNVNAVKTVFDFAPWSPDDFASGDYSGLIALETTRDSIQAASDEGSTVVDQCSYVPGGEGCGDKVQGFLDLVVTSIEEMQTWEA
jgi:hypothetical protein